MLLSCILSCLINACNYSLDVCSLKSDKVHFYITQFSTSLVVKIDWKFSKILHYYNIRVVHGKYQQLAVDFRIPEYPTMQHLASLQLVQASVF